MELAAALKVKPVELTTTRLRPEGATLVELRHASGLTRRKTAERLGVAEQTLDAIERGYRPLKPEILKKLARILGRSQDVVAAAHKRGTAPNNADAS